MPPVESSPADSRLNFDTALRACLKYLNDDSKINAEIVDANDVNAETEKADRETKLKCLEEKKNQLNNTLKTELSNIISAFVTTNNQHDCKCCDNILLIKGIVSFLVGRCGAGKEKELDQVQEVTKIFVDIVQSYFGKKLIGFCGEKISFDTISQIKRAFWSPRESKTRQRFLSPAHKVIRINDIPFAESVYPALLTRSSEELGYTIIVEDVQWSEIGAALYNKKIDVALYNGALKAQLKSVETLFDRKLVYRSEPLIKYVQYAIIRRINCSDKVQNTLGVPWKSDFEVVIKQHRDKGGVSLTSDGPERRNLNSVNIVYLDSADDVLGDVVNDELEFGIVGGLQAKYAADQFGEYVKIELYIDNLDDSEADCRFWVAANRKDEAERLLSAMTTLWNELAVRGWEKTINHQVNAVQNELVAIVNEHHHRSYVQDFRMLRGLIEFHDRNLDKIVPYKCNFVEL